LFLGLAGTAVGFAVTGHDRLAHGFFAGATVFGIITTVIVTRYYSFGPARNWMSIGFLVVVMFTVDRCATIAPAPSPSPTPVPLTALYIGCEFDHIPISIQPAASIHVMWLDPAILRGNPNIPFLGPFDDIRAPTGKEELKWPTSKEGRWMKRAEIQEAMKVTGTMATSFSYRCKLNNYAVTLDEISAQLIVDTSDSKRHTYNVQFSPSVLGHPFEFFMVNKCSSGVVPQLVQWGDTANVRILGETIRRKIPLQFERKAFPSNLMPLLGSSFIWNDRKDGCEWDR
jgi:hypothetical protein